MESVLNSTIYVTNESVVYTAAPEMELCRERHGEFPPVIYNLITCAMCYNYIYTDYNVSLDDRTLELVTGTNTAYPEGTRMVVDPDNATLTNRVCGSLFDPSECWKWQECCRQARICCQTQITVGPKPSKDYGRTLCPRTWDGYACWPDTPAGQTPNTRCPSHVQSADTGRKSNPRWYAYKTCTRNATWYINPLSHKEWTDYTECNNIEDYHRLHKATLACNIITIFLLVPACIIFLYFRPLRQQQRIRLHICLMISSFVNSVSMLTWEIVINKDNMETEVRAEVTMNQNSVGCRLLCVLTRYGEVASFMWMFIEGFHLHRLLVHAFTVPKTLIPYYIFGFGFPLVPVAVYSIIRATNSHFNRKCWMNAIDDHEWILFAPNLAALVMNIFFLLRIVFIMVRQLEPHPNEPSNFRRAVKAVVVLVPLFGVQFLLFVYRPSDESLFLRASELLSKIFSSLQGAFISITVCYLNNEVQGYLKTSCMRLLRQTGRKDFNSRSLTMTTQYVSELSRTRSSNGSGDFSHMIALKPIYRLNISDDPNTKEMSIEFMNGNMHTIPENLEEELPLSQERQYS